jgi:hypothetical protein
MRGGERRRELQGSIRQPLELDRIVRAKHFDLGLMRARELA